MNTGISFEQWIEGDIRALMTALDLMGSKPVTPDLDSDGRQMSG